MILRKKPEVSLKLKYPFILKNGTVLVLAVFVILMVLFPRMEKNVSGRAEVKIFADLEKVAITEQKIEQIKAPSKPSIPVESEDEDFEQELDFELETFEDYEGAWDAAPPPPEDEEDSGPRVKFIPYDDPPEPKGGFAAIQRNVIYPEIAQEAGIEGQVVIQAFVDEKGNVGQCNVLKGIPNTGLNEAAITAIKKTKFKPAKQRDRNVGVWISIPVVFKLKN